MQTLKYNIMDEILDVFDEVLLPFGLICNSSGCSGQKLQFVSIHNNSEFDTVNEISFSINWHGELIIESFNGIMNVLQFCELLEALRLKVIELKL